MLSLFLSSQEIANILNIARQNVEKRAKKEQWASCKRKGQGGGKAWKLSSMSATFLQRLQNNTLLSIPVVQEDKPQSINVALPVQKRNFTEEKEKVRDARVYILQHLDEMALKVGKLNSYKEFSERASKNLLEESMQNILELAKGKKTDVGISASTLRTWQMLKTKFGNDALIPKSRERLATRYPPWLPAMLKEYRKPSKPGLAQCYEILQKQGVELPTLRTVQRSIKKLGSVELQKGRMLPREHKKLTAFVRRDFSKLLPGDVYTADGHTVDMYVLHPAHGKPFRPEITSIIDVATRVCTGWSISLNENSWGVADAIRMSVQNFGIPAIFYTDNGSGFKNKMLEAQNTGLLVRLGITPQHSLPYASQSRGVIERFQQVYITGAREFAGYAGKDMDKEALQCLYKLAKKEIKQTGSTNKFLSWEQFFTWAQNLIESYNNRIHSTLKESPYARWERLAELADLEKAMPEEIDDMFRPYELRKVARCEVRMFNSIYFSLNLENYQSDQVRVGYDIHDPSKVWIRDLEGRFITHAELNGNSRDYFPQSFVETAREKRFEGKIKRLDEHKELALEEFKGNRIIECEPLTPEQEVKHEALILEFKQRQDDELIEENTRESRFAQALALQDALARGNDIGNENTRKLKIYTKTPEYKSMRYVYEEFGQEFNMYNAKEL